MFDSLFGNKNPADSASKYYNQVPGVLHEGYDDYITNGKKNMGTLNEQIQKLIYDPSGLYNSMGKGYQQSPGYEFNVQQATQGAKNAAAASGQAGSSATQLALAQKIAGLSSQDYNQYMGNIMQMYGMGMNGAQDMMHQGYNASDSLTQGLASNLMSQGNLAYTGQQNKNQSNSEFWKTIAAMGGAAAGVPTGGMGGSSSAAQPMMRYN
jgi:hypothetical protein